MLPVQQVKDKEVGVKEIVHEIKKKQKQAQTLITAVFLF